jgi:hypothetical protein
VVVSFPFQEGKRVACVWVRLRTRYIGSWYCVALERISVMKIEGLPVIDVDESEKITVAVRADDLLEGDAADPERHPIAIALRSQNPVDAGDKERDAGPPR